MNKRNLFLKHIILVCMMLLGSSATLWGQVTVKGVVVDPSGEPIIGANILEVGTTNGTVTDFDGNFTLSVKQLGAELNFSYIGYVTQVAKATRDMKITLQEDNETLEEVVVVGYGVTKRKNFTGSVATVKVSEGGISMTAPNNALDMLRGVSPGLQMSQTGFAGQEPTIQIRGQKSISGSSQPLLVVDGVIFKGSINDIDPANVESMSVLKDATSLAAYGSQAANGVIMITTKKGNLGKPIINFKGSLAVLTPNYKPDLRDGYEYIERYNAQQGREPNDVSWMSNLERANYDKGEWTDWFDYATRTGLRQNYSLNISGATENMDYLVGVSHLDNKNFIKHNDYIRETVNARVNSKINKYIKAGLNFNFSTYKNDGVTPSVGRMYSPWGEPYLSDGKTMRKYLIGGTDTNQTNPLWSSENGVDRENRNHAITMGGEIEIKLPWIEGLSYKMTGSYTVRNSKLRYFQHELNLIQATDGEDYSSTVTDRYLSQANGYITDTNNTSYVLDNILTYTREFGPHFVSATLVYTRDSDKQEGTTMTGLDFAGLGNTTLGFYGLNNAKTQEITTINYTLHNNVGYLGRINYSYRDTYHFNASVRRDGSSVFGSDKKWGVFPAVGVAWVISNEEFFKKAVPWATNTKLKLSWGKNGNQSIQPYGTLSRMNVGKAGGYVYYFDNIAYFSQSLSTLGNPMLGWETTTSWNYGLETDLLKNRIHFEVDAYNASTTDQIFNRTILPMGAGIRNQSSTMGRVDNWGIEASVNTTNIKTKDFMWTSGLQFTINRNKLKELYGDGKDDIQNQLFLNKSLGAIYGYKWIGVVQESDTNYMQANGARPGDPMYANLDGSEDGKISPADKTILGYAKESFRMSLSNTLIYKNWSLYFMLNGVFSGGMYGKAQNNFAYGSQDGSMDYLNTNDHPYWTPENRSNTYLRPGYDVTNSDFIALQNYGFVRLQDVNLSYNFKQSWMKKVGIAGLQVYVSGSNLFCFAPGWDFSDPEVRSSRAQQLARTYTFGVNVRF